ncbi:hypothetical protein J6TS7_55670 [Paenibacillus dendritiformis]|nr:hypothetical protein J6TS7_55670 [Paenibacillus dendritiformis]
MVEFMYVEELNNFSWPPFGLFSYFRKIVVLQLSEIIPMCMAILNSYFRTAFAVHTSSYS